MIRENSMNESNSLNRRDALKGVAAATLGIATGALGIPEVQGQTDPMSSSSSPPTWVTATFLTTAETSLRLTSTLSLPMAFVSPLGI